MSRVKEQFEPDTSWIGTNYEIRPGWPKPNREYERHMDMQAAKRVVREASPGELQEIVEAMNAKGWVVAPKRLVRSN